MLALASANQRSILWMLYLIHCRWWQDGPVRGYRWLSQVQEHSPGTLCVARWLTVESARALATRVP